MASVKRVVLLRLARVVGCRRDPKMIRLIYLHHAVVSSVEWNMSCRDVVAMSCCIRS
ncbi:hypothetical protein BAUCODRAFT_507851 [Baudoinia panamericana UAMH 10762]|uniref:Uncharacterized protein n=1 Tax=Baudoinia panamericana (strain UAMH 10762) TaxID=717646 RepID=M2MWH4_BAUPA|nr:uncharacterized protein BAUCODRAFT_507851 [Baudoinia panamericana UAMH 10762]EMC95898.1 hypothetical protein BAUCODRAFT_507851 [Baudoinia panamericana UAMH 10762]